MVLVVVVVVVVVAIVSHLQEYASLGRLRGCAPSRAPAHRVERLGHLLFLLKWCGKMVAVVVVLVVVVGVVGVGGGGGGGDGGGGVFLWWCRWW